MTLTATRRPFVHKDLPNASSKGPFPISALALMSSGRQTPGVMSEGESARRAVKARVPKVPSLVFDIEIEDCAVAAPAESHESKAVVQEVKRLSRPTSYAEHKLSSDVIAALKASTADQRGFSDHSSRVAALAQQLTDEGYNVSLRTALGGGDGSECLHNLRHCYLFCRLQSGSAYIIDPFFKEQFTIACSTARYRIVHDAVPEAFVGQEQALLALVQLLCAEMAFSFKASGAVMPPWRQEGSMLSKWKPRRSLESPVQQLSALPAQVQAHQQQQQQQRLGSQAAMHRAVQHFSSGVYGPGSRQGSPASSFEPLRIVVGGNFTTVPTPACT